MEIHHGGYFCGLGINRSYLDYSTDWFDNCDADSWSLLWLEDFVKQLGYTISAADSKFYWCLPDKNVGNGLRPLRCDADMVLMVNAITDCNNLVVIVDHVNFLGNLNWNDVLANGPAVFPTGISPVKEGFSEKNKEINLNPLMKNLRHKKLDPSRACVEDEYEDIEDENEEDSDGSDSDFIDSEYEVDQGDDDLFYDNVDVLVEDKSGKEEANNT